MIADGYDGLVERATALVELDRHEAALEAAVRALALNPAGGARAHCLMVLALLGLDRPGDAVAAAERAAAAAPDWEWPHRLRAIAFQGLCRNGEALAAAEEALRLAPSEPSVLAVVSDCRRDVGDMTGAETAAREAVRVAPDNVHGHNALAAWALAAGRPREAEDAWRRSLALDPTDAGVVNNLGVAQLGSWRVLAALRTYSLALQMDPSEDLPLRNLRGFFRLLFGITAFFAIIAVANVGDWWTGFFRLGAPGRLAVGLAVAVAGLAVWVGGPWLVGRLPAPAVLVARDMLSIRTPGGLKIWFGVGAIVLLGGASLVLDPIVPDDRRSGFILGAFGLVVCVVSGARLANRSRPFRPSRIGAEFRAFRLRWARRQPPSQPQSRPARARLRGAWLALVASVFLLLGSLSLAISPEESGDRSAGLTTGPPLLIASTLLVRRLFRHHRSARRRRRPA